MYRITQKQKLNLRKIERWAVHSRNVTWDDWITLAKYLGWDTKMDSDDNRDLYESDHDCKLCNHISYDEEQRTTFNLVRKLYSKRNN